MDEGHRLRAAACEESVREVTEELSTPRASVGVGPARTLQGLHHKILENEAASGEWTVGHHELRVPRFEVRVSQFAPVCTCPSLHPFARKRHRFWRVSRFVPVCRFVPPICRCGLQVSGLRKSRLAPACVRRPGAGHPGLAVRVGCPRMARLGSFGLRSELA